MTMSKNAQVYIARMQTDYNLNSQKLANIFISTCPNDRFIILIILYDTCDRMVFNADSLDPDGTPSHSAFHLDPNFLTIIFLCQFSKIIPGV